MPFDGLLIHHLNQELNTKIVGLKVDKINQPHRNTFTFGFHKKTLLISVEPSMSYYSLTNNRFKNPDQPPMFCMLLRKHLLGATLLSVEQVGADRTVYFRFDATHNFERTKRTLVVEAMGRHANIALLDEDNVIIDSIKRSSIDARGTLPGLPFSPFLDGRKNPLEARHINEPTMYHGLSKIAIKYLSDFPEELRGTEKKGYIAWINGAPVDYYFSKPALLHFFSDATVKEYPGISEALDTYYFSALQTLKIKQSAHSTRATVVSRMEKLTSKLGKLRDELQVAEAAEQFKRLGDLIMSNVHAIKEGSNRAIVLDYAQDPPAEIELKLDTKLTAVQNAQKYYAKYKKAMSAQKYIREQIAHTETDIEYLASTLVLLDHATNEEDLAQIKEELAETGFLAKGKQSKTEKSAGKVRSVKKNLMAGISKYRTPSGMELWVGRSNTANDQLTMKLASNADTWLHASKIPGSHCIIRTEGKEPTDEDIAYAAGICAYFSKGKQSPKVDVDYCLVKYVKKPPGSRPGAVIYSHFKTVYITPRNPEEL